MALQEIEFASANGRDTIQAWLHTPIAEPKAIVQIVHGLGEHPVQAVHAGVPAEEHAQLLRAAHGEGRAVGEDPAPAASACSRVRDSASPEFSGRFAFLDSRRVT